MAPQQVIVITGANKGLGLEHVVQFLEKTNHRLIATARAPEKASDLQKLASSHEGRLHILQLDATDDDSIQVQCFSGLAPCLLWLIWAGTQLGHDTLQCSTLACSKPVTWALGLQYADSCFGTVLQAFAKEVERLEPEGVDILVNNAGQGEYTSRAIET